jgi:hypothetical protein
MILDEAVEKAPAPGERDLNVIKQAPFQKATV